MRGATASRETGSSSSKSTPRVARRDAVKQQALAVGMRSGETNTIIWSRDARPSHSINASSTETDPVPFRLAAAGKAMGRQRRSGERRVHSPVDSLTSLKFFVDPGSALRKGRRPHRQEKAFQVFLVHQSSLCSHSLSQPSRISAVPGTTAAHPRPRCMHLSGGDGSVTMADAGRRPPHLYFRLRRLVRRRRRPCTDRGTNSMERCPLAWSLR